MFVPEIQSADVIHLYLVFFFQKQSVRLAL